MKDTTYKATLIGTLIAAFIASLCCIGPVVFAILGISAGSLAVVFEPYRPFLIGLTVLLLVVAFYFTYRKKDVTECKPDSFCANPKSTRINKIVLWVVAVIALSALTFPYWAEWVLL